MSVLFGFVVALGMLLTLLVAAGPTVLDVLDARAAKTDPHRTKAVRTPHPAA